MGSGGLLYAGLDLAMREAALFAACGFLVLGTGDLLVDLIWIGVTVRRRVAPRRERRAESGALAPATASGRLAVFIPAWDEAVVIGDMLRHALETFRHDDYRLYVGCYPNDPATLAAVRAVGDRRVRLAVGQEPGPTTKADCLNRIWQALLEDEAAGGWRVKAVVLHDAEDVVHPDELRIFDALIERLDLVQLPVLPLVDAGSRWIAGHYIDEFAESHGKELVVREALGAGLPSAGVGCAFSRHVLAAIAADRGGMPFDADSLTEDYELGLRIRARGGRAAFVRLPVDDGRAVVATREYFPCTLNAAVSQKARWVTGIALSGWDRLGWSGGVAERWMRLRDRQFVLAAAFIFAGYLALLLWILLSAGHVFLGVAPPPLEGLLRALLTINLWMLGWRLTMRFAFVARAYGWREGLRSLPRVLIGNVIAMLAARRAVIRYRAIRRSGRPRWHKTSHAFPTIVPAE